MWDEMLLLLLLTHSLHVRLSPLLLFSASRKMSTKSAVSLTSLLQRAQALRLEARDARASLHAKAETDLATTASTQELAALATSEAIKLVKKSKERMLALRKSCEGEIVWLLPSRQVVHLVRECKLLHGYDTIVSAVFLGDDGTETTSVCPFCVVQLEGDSAHRLFRQTVRPLIDEAEFVVGSFDAKCMFYLEDDPNGPAHLFNICRRPVLTTKKKNMDLKDTNMPLCRSCWGTFLQFYIDPIAREQAEKNAPLKCSKWV